MPAIINYSPDYAIYYNAYMLGPFELFIDRLTRLKSGKLEAYPRIDINPTIKDLQDLVGDCLKRDEPICFDLETMPDATGVKKTALSIETAQIRTIGFGNTRWGMSFSWSDIENSRSFKEYFSFLMSNSQICKVGHNSLWFDEPIIKRYGYIIVNHEDTRTQRKALCNWSKLKLRFLGSLATDIHDWKDYENEANQLQDAEEKPEEEEFYWEGEQDPEDAGSVEDSGNNDEVFFTSKLEDLKYYNALDCVVTARVRRMNKNDELSLPPDYKLTAKNLNIIHNKLIEVDKEMHVTGLRFRKDKHEELIATYEKGLAEEKSKFLNLVGIDGMKVTPDGMRSIIFQRHATDKISKFNLPDPKDKMLFTKNKDKVSVNAKSLILFMASEYVPPELIPIIDTWWKLSEYKHELGVLKSKKLLNNIVNGLIKPNWNSAGADTMRFTCSNPTVMNWKQETRCIIGPDEDHVWVHVDKSQLEVRVMEAVSGDENLKAMLDTGDLYSAMACEWFKLNKTKFNKKNPADHKIRHTTKTAFLARQYAAKLKTVYAQMLEVDRKFTIGATKAIINKFDTVFAGGILPYWESEKEFVFKNGYSEGLILGGRHYYPAAPDISEIANKKIQRTAAEMMNVETLALREDFRKYVPDTRIIIQLHDALDAQVHKSKRKEVEELMEQHLGSTRTINGRTRTFPVEIKTADGSKGETWANV